MMKILLVDDHALFRHGLAELLKHLDSDNEKIETLEANTCAQAIEMAERYNDIALVILDLSLPDKSGFETLEIFSNSYPTCPVTILSASNNIHEVRRCLELGALGFINKSTDSTNILEGVRKNLQGEIYVDPDFEHAISGSCQQPRELFGSSTQGGNIKLTAREMDVLKCMVTGKLNKQIAADLGIAESTVKTHISTILRLLNVANRTQATIRAIELGIVN